MLYRSIAVFVFAVAALAATAAALEAPSRPQQVYNIMDYGARPNDASSEAGFANGAAINAALIQANATAGPNVQTVVLIPGGQTFTFIPDTTPMSYLHDIDMQIDAEVVAFKQTNLTTATAVWPYADGKFHDFFLWSDCTDMYVYGAGRIDGNGYEWWWASFLKTIDDASRPHIWVLNGARNIAFSGLRLKNSPEYHMILTDIDTLNVWDMDIRVDVDVQRELLRHFGAWDETIGIPIFPLNTDGIDPAGKNVYIRNVSISNFDDAVAVKPSNGAFRYATCSENIVVEDSHVTWGLGMTIGSVPPHEDVNCVRNVIFRRINFTLPIKAVYVKTNPGDTGSGLISNITYEDCYATDAVWWAIYIGPQQQKQPDGDGAGCMLYPIDPNCPTNPRVPITDIVLRNFYIDGTLFSPAIIRCNETAPCTGFVFDNVVVTHYDRFPFGDGGYKIENAYGSTSGSLPAPVFDGPFPKFNPDVTAAAADDEATAAQADADVSSSDS